eukprot:TRINITY_DN2465_c0_g1_i4.p1 TRINITY_DN2465_c0_g1~~TRINITY_DN2465_c0_g1_i4.p1  ORF type:complete len:421 (-),score=106.22 TRINITY_DN2465_c0_g1_i4:101-1363(-)
MEPTPPYETIFRTCKLAESEQQVLLQGVNNAESVREAPWNIKASLVRDALSSNLGGFWNCCCGWEYANNILYASGSYAAVEIKRDGKRTLYVVWRSPGASFLTAGTAPVPDHLTRPLSVPVVFVQNVSTPMQEVAIVNLFNEAVKQQGTYTTRAKELKFHLENCWGKPIQVIIGKDGTWGAAIYPGDLCTELTLEGHKLLVYRHLDNTHLRAAVTPADVDDEHEYARELLDASPQQTGYRDLNHLVATLTGLMNREYRFGMALHLFIACVIFVSTFLIRMVDSWVAVGLVSGIVALRTFNVVLSFGALPVRLRLSWAQAFANLFSLGTWGFVIYQFVVVGKLGTSPWNSQREIPFIVQMVSFGLSHFYWLVFSIDSSDRGVVHFDMRRITLWLPSSCHARSYTLNSDQLLRQESRPINYA